MSEKSPDFNPFDFTRLFSDMNFPGFADFQTLGETTRRNMEALVAVNKVALEGAQTVLRRNMEILQQAMTDMSQGVKAISTAEDPRETASKQTEMLRQGYQQAIANVKELTDVVQKSNNEAVKLLNDRFAEAMEELRRITQKPSGKLG